MYFSTRPTRPANVHSASSAKTKFYANGINRCNRSWPCVHPSSILRKRSTTPRTRNHIPNFWNSPRSKWRRQLHTRRPHLHRKSTPKHQSIPISQIRSHNMRICSNSVSGRTSPSRNWTQLGQLHTDPPQFTGSPPPNTNQYQHPGSGATTQGFAPTASAGGPVHHGIGHNWGSYTQDPPQFTRSPPPNTNQYQYPGSGFIPSTEATTGGFAPTAGRRVHPQELYDQQTPSPGSMYQHQGQRPSHMAVKRPACENFDRQSPISFKLKTENTEQKCQEPESNSE